MKLDDALDRLDGVEKRGKGWIAFCPAHDDKREPSLSITRSTEKPGQAVFHCFAGCEYKNIVAALNGHSNGNGHAPTVKRVMTQTQVLKIPATEPLAWLAHYTGLEQAFLKTQAMDFTKPGRVGYKFTGSTTIKWRIYSGRGQKGQWQSDGGGQPPLWPVIPDECSQVVFIGAGETDVLCLRAALADSGVDAFALTKGEGHIPDGALKELHRRGAHEIVYIPDLDSAGQKAVRGLAQAAEKNKLKFTVIDLGDHLDASLGEKDVRDLSLKVGTEALRDILEDAYAAPPSILSLSSVEYAAMAPDRINWLVYPLIAVGTTTLLSGFAKAGKTTFLFHLMREMKRGGKLLDYDIEKAKVLVWTENSAVVWRAKCESLFGSVYPEHVRVISRDHEALLGHTFEENARVVFNEAKQLKTRMVVLDSLAGITGIEDENDASKVSETLVLLNRLARKYGMALVLIHHLNKAGASPRGSGVFQAEPDTLLEIKGEYKEPRTLKVKTNLLLDPPADLVFRMDSTGGYEKVEEVEEDDAQEILDVLPKRAEDAMTVRQLMDELDLEYNPATRMAMLRKLAALGKMAKVKKVPGGKGASATYYRVILRVVSGKGERGEQR